MPSDIEVLCIDDQVYLNRDDLVAAIENIAIDSRHLFMYGMLLDLAEKLKTMPLDGDQEIVRLVKKKH